MIHCNLSTLMGKNRMSIKDVSERAGLNRNTVSKLYHDQAKRIDYDTLDKLCNLFKCLPGEMLEKTD